jgi:hypothetical protein
MEACLIKFNLIRDRRQRTLFETTLCLNLILRFDNQFPTSL